MSLLPLSGRPKSALQQRPTSRIGLAQNTLILFFGDRGYQMGKHGTWGQKHSNMEISTRVPLIVTAPGAVADRQTAALVELVDFFPTLAESCGLAVTNGLEGTSFVPLLTAPDRPWKSAVFTLPPKTAPYQVKNVPLTGRAICTANYRYVEWRKEDGTLVARELYEQQGNQDYTTNLAVRPEQELLLREYSGRLAAGWRNALPPK